MHSLEKQNFRNSYRKQPSIRDMLLRVKIQQPTHPQSKGCNSPHSCKYSSRVSQSGAIKNLLNMKTYSTIKNGTCQSNKLIYCLECIWCNIKYDSHLDPRMTIHILENVRLPKDMPRSHIEIRRSWSEYRDQTL